MFLFPFAAALAAALAAPVPAAAELLVAPTRVVLTPEARSAQLVLVNKSAETAAFRIAIEARLMSAPVSAGAATVAGEGLADNSLSIELAAIRSITIPVVLRVGTLEASVTMDSAAIADTAPDQLVVRGVAIYVPNTARDVIVPLPPEARAQLAGKKVRIDYTSTDFADPANAGKRLASLVAVL